MLRMNCAKRSELRATPMLGKPIIAVIAAMVALVPGGMTQEKDAKIGEFYQTTNLFSAHFKFTKEQWDAMEPAGGGGPFVGGRGGPGGGPFGPAMFLAPTILNQADKNSDRKISKDEFSGLAEDWFGKWDKEKRGRINANELREGLNSAAGPAGGPPRMPGLNLQGAEGKRNGLASAAGIEFNYVKADLQLAGKNFSNVAVRYKGNGTWMQSRGSDKRSMKVDLNEFVKGQKISGVSKLNFHNNVTDASSMNEVLSHRLYRDAGVPAPESAYARVHVTVPGKWENKYLGLYSMIENVDDNFAEKHFGTKKGAILKPVTPALFFDLGDDWAKYNQTYDPKDDLPPEDSQRVIAFAKLVTHADDAEFAQNLPEYLDLDQFARYMAVTTWLATMDSILGPGQNYYLYLHPKTRKFQFIPWDLDHSFGQFPLMGSQEQRENLSINKPWNGENRFLDRVYKVEAFKKIYLARMEEFSKTIFQPERFHRQVDEVAFAIAPAIKEESESRFERFSTVVKGESVSPAGFGGGPGPGGPPPREGDGPGPRFGGFMGNVKPIKPFVVARALKVEEQLAGKSQGETVGGFGGGPGRGGPGGPGGFGPGMFLGGAFLSTLDVDKSGEITKAEFTDGFGKWFAAWNKDGSGQLTEEQLREGINKDLSPMRGGFPGGPRGPGGPGERR